MSIRQFTTRISLTLVCLAWFGALSPRLQARPRLLADAEMDQVCAKGSTGFNVDSAVLNQMIFDFSRQTPLGQVSGSGAISVEVIPNTTGKSQILVGAPPTVGTPTTTGATPIVIPATNIQAVNGTVQVSGDLNINMQTLPGVLRALQQNRLVLPPGFNSFSTLGGMR